MSYLTVTDAPAASSFPLASSAASLVTFSRSAFGAPSTRSLASLRPRPETISRTTLMTPIFLSPAASRITSNSLCSSAASAGAPAPAAPGAAATATGAAAVTSKVSSNAFTKSESSSRVISLNVSSSWSVDILAMVWVLPQYLSMWGFGCYSAAGSATAGSGSAASGPAATSAPAGPGSTTDSGSAAGPGSTADSGSATGSGAAAGSWLAILSCSAAQSRAKFDAGALNRPAALVKLPFIAPASLASSTSRDSRSAMRSTSATVSGRPSM